MRRAVVIAVNAVVYLFMLAPILVVIPVSFSETPYLVFPPRGFSLRWYANFFATRELADSLWTSLHLAAWTTAICTVLGTMAAVALMRYHYPGREALRTLLMAPMVMPRLVLGIALLMVYPIKDPDLWWLLAGGQYMVEHRTFLTTDPFSASARGATWLNHAWGFELILYGAYRTGESVRGTGVHLGPPQSRRGRRAGERVRRVEKHHDQVAVRHVLARRRR